MKTPTYKLLTVAGFNRGTANGTTKLRAYVQKNGSLQVLSSDIQKAANRLDDTDVHLPDVAGFSFWHGSADGQSMIAQVQQ